MLYENSHKYYENFEPGDFSYICAPMLYIPVYPVVNINIAALVHTQYTGMYIYIFYISEECYYYVR